MHYSLSERQLRAEFQKAKTSKESTGSKLLGSIERRLTSLVFHGGLAPTIFAAKQAVNHRHVLVDGRVVDRAAFHVKPGQVISINAERSPAIAELARKTNAVIPPYLEVDRDNLKVTLAREPLPDEIPAGVEITRVVEFYAR
jgi:small subunit ribosomal protein S4